MVEEPPEPVVEEPPQAASRNHTPVRMCGGFETLASARSSTTDLHPHPVVEGNARPVVEEPPQAASRNHPTRPATVVEELLAPVVEEARSAVSKPHHHPNQDFGL